MANDITMARGVDLPRENRPGVPKERRPPRPVGHAHWVTPEKQEPREPILMLPDREEPTPVFSSAVPPKGLSGAIRRAAYRIPDHYARHWLLLMVADRVDVQESRLSRLVRSPVALRLAAIGGGLLVVRGLRRR